MHTHKESDHKNGLIGSEHKSAASPLKHLKGLFSYYIEHPNGIRFETQQKEEQIILFLRPHIITNIPWLVFALLLILTPLLMWPFIIATDSLPFPIPIRYIFVLTLFWYVVTFGFVVASFLHWYFNIYIVTNQRIVDIDFIHLLYRKFSATNIHNIQDITYTQAGFLRTMFDYGHIYIQTAGTLDNFDFLDIPNPQHVTDSITKLLHSKGISLKTEKERSS